MILNETQELIQQTVAEYCQNKILPNSAKWEEEKFFPKETLREMADLGLWGITVPEECGGSGLDSLTLAVALEEIAAANGAISTILSVQNSLICNILLKYGTEQQKNQWLVGAAKGDLLGCFCLTEPHVGSDAAAITTKAKRQGDYWQIDGVKQFITSGKNAQIAIVLAVTDASLGKKGISCFVVPTNTAGYIVARVEDKMGQNLSDTAQIIFDNCLIPAENLIGNLGDGYKIALANLEAGRIGIAAQSVGMARAAFEAACSYAQQRESFGKVIFQHQAVQFRLAEMATELEAARQLIWHAATLRDNGKPCLKEASMAKLFASEMAERVCSSALQIHGGYGYCRDYPIERICRDVRVCQIYEGASDIQKMVIARSLINPL